MISGAQQFTLSCPMILTFNINVISWVKVKIDSGACVNRYIKRKIMFRWFYIFWFLCVLGNSAVAQDLKIVTATWAPYMYQQEDGSPSGIGTEIVQATLAKAGIEAGITFYPWARAYKVALEEPNILVYMIIKLPEREPSFKWVGPIVSVKSVLHKHKNRKDVTIGALEDAKAFTIGTTRNAAGHQFLLNRGFKEKKHVYVQDSNKESVRKFFEGRVDLESSVDLNFMYEAKRGGFSYSDVEQAWVLFENEGYMAFSRSTPDEVVERVQAAFDQIKAAGVVDTILEKYLKKYQ